MKKLKIITLNLHSLSLRIYLATGYYPRRDSRGSNSNCVGE